MYKAKNVWGKPTKAPRKRHGRQVQKRKQRGNSQSMLMNDPYRKAQDQDERPVIMQFGRLREGLFLFSFACAIFLLISLMSYHAQDPGWSSSTSIVAPIANWGGRVGAWVADLFLFVFGLAAYLFPFLLGMMIWGHYAKRVVSTAVSRYETIFRWAGLCLLISSGCGLVHFYFHHAMQLPSSPGGMIGEIVGRESFQFFSKVGGTLLLGTAFLCGITLITGLSWLRAIGAIGRGIARGYHMCRFPAFWAPKKVVSPPSLASQPPLECLAPTLERPIFLEAAPPPVVAGQLKCMEDKASLGNSMNMPKLLSSGLPPVALLTLPPPSTKKPFASVTFDELSVLVEQRLADFGVIVKVVAVHPGPVVTRFELELAPGIKVSKISGLSKDIARALSSVSVRVVEVVPGKSVIGLELPNENRELVTLRDVLESQRYLQVRSPVSLVLGKDISGNPVVVDLAKMPHLLVAGTTGAGKSVSLNAMLLSMLFKATPEQLRFILIDPKMLELSLYEGVPHLLAPVITDMKNAANALRWCVNEMDKRYRLMASLGVRNLAGYNQKVNEAIKQGRPLPVPAILAAEGMANQDCLRPMPLIVVIADELADMMMVVGKKVEDLIARIAQKARAAGIHLILATQRPSVDVITGLIKANVPSRIAFQVSSRIDSRTILDQQGAEQLLGHGDMLYLPPGAGTPVRVHGAYVTDEEVHRVVAAWRSYGQPDYVQEITEEEGNTEAGEGNGQGEQDPLYDEAVKVVTENRRASISLVQRRLRIGYNRAARMMEDMEMAGVVSPMDNNGSRDVLCPGDA